MIDNIVSVIEGAKKISEINPIEVVATFKGFEDTSSPSDTRVRLISLTDVYARCNVRMIEPKKYEEVAINDT